MTLVSAGVLVWAAPQPDSRVTAKAADNMRMVFFFIKAHPFLFLGWSQHTIAPGKRGYRHITV